MPLQCGIYPSLHSSSFPLIGARCHYSVIDVQTVTSLVQSYVSDAYDAQPVVYVFPLPPEAAVCAFKAIIDWERVVKGVVQEKAQAKQNYERAFKEGKTAGLLEKQHEDVFQISLGNIQPNQRIDIHITFTSIIKHDGSLPHGLRLMIPISIAPRYGLAPTAIEGAVPRASKMDITISATMSGSISSVSCPTHPVVLTLGVDHPSKTGQGAHDPTKAHVAVNGEEYLDRDIVIIIASKDLDRPRCIVETSVDPQTSAFALSFVPQFNLPALSNQSYIFLVDRSGSMARRRIKAVRTALQIMLRSLPTKNTSFNIWSFGDRHKSLWPSNKTYSSESVTEATTHVDRIQANYGGTEIKTAFVALYANVKAGYSSSPVNASLPSEPTSVFVLTDGEAWDIEGVLNTVCTAFEDGKAAGTLLRTFVLGVGNNVSTPMCEGIARAGGGLAVFVSDDEKPEIKLMGLLRSARGGVVDDLSVEWGIPDELRSPQTEDFEMIDPPSAATAPFSPPHPLSSLRSTPLSPFDPTSKAGPVDDVNLEPESVLVKLGPSPFLQQAPATMDRLPIPLYPGFRCSIFALLQTHLTVPPANVTITGKVLGRDVMLTIPATTSPGGRSGEGAANIHLPIHTLAARALVQQLEDQASSPQRDAEIVRLALNYPLATSQTSFVAIAEEEEVLASEEISAPRHRRIFRRSAPAEEYLEDEYEEEDEDDEVEVAGSAAPRRRGRGAGLRPFLDLQAEVDAEDDDDAVGDADDVCGFIEDNVEDEEELLEEHVTEHRHLKRRRISRPPTIETLARAQDFIGSFPLSAITEVLDVTSPEVPPRLLAIVSISANTLASELQDVIWSTILVVVYLRTKFAGEMDAWSMMEEKAIEFIRGFLVKRGVVEADMDDIVEELCEEAMKVM